jgi:predicted anti-sigma-YlaC factor YlaD
MVLDRLLVADLDELEGRTDTPLARHLRVCPSCRAAARRIVEDTAILAARLAVDAERPDADALLAAARAADPRAAVGLASAGWRLGPRELSWLGLAAAAGLAAVLLRPPPTPPDRSAASDVSAAALPLVEAAPDRDVAVLPTRDPDITVVWFFPPRSDR